MKLKVGTIRDLGDGFTAEVVHRHKGKDNAVDVHFSNGRLKLYVSPKEFMTSQFETKRNTRVKDRTGEQRTFTDGRVAQIINYENAKNIDLLIDNREVILNTTYEAFLNDLWCNLDFKYRNYNKMRGTKSTSQSYSGVIQPSKKAKKEQKQPRREDLIGKVVNTKSFGTVLICSCTSGGITFIDEGSCLHTIDKEDFV